MRKQDFNHGWRFSKKGSSNAVTVTLPHDAQIREQRSKEASDGGHGYFPGGVYTYEKTKS